MKNLVGAAEHDERFVYNNGRAGRLRKIDTD